MTEQELDILVNIFIEEENMSIKYRTGQGTSASDFTDLVVKVGDTLPIGSEIDYDGQTAPAGWQEVDDPNVYSTAETKVGTWIDGKPLYRKVVYISSLPNNTMTTYQVFNDKSIIDTCFIDSSGSYIKIAQEVDTLNWIYSTTGFMMTCLVGKEIRIKTTDDKSTAHAYIAVCYTKTTD